MSRLPVTVLIWLRQLVWRPSFERSLRYPSRRWFIASSGAGLAIGAAVLVALLYVIGDGPVTNRGAFVKAISTAAESPVVSAVIALAMAILCAWSLRRLSFEYLAWRPGVILVPDFASLASLANVTPVQLTAQFRSRLSTLRLQSGSPAPGAAPPSDFLGVLGESNGGEGNLSTLIRLLRAAFPAASLEVRGTLVEREHPSQPCGVSLQVTRLPDQGSILGDIWAATWASAVDQAADQAVAAILPRTRLCRGPWVSWRGYVMPPELIGAYEEAQRLEHERRYESALDACYRALEHDPFNRELRLQLGKLQEQLGRFLDALTTYDGILLAVRPAGRLLPHRLYRRQARLERRRVGHIVNYRHIVLLGGRKIVEQWEELEKRPATDLQRQNAKRLLSRMCAARVDLELNGNAAARRTLQSELVASAYRKATKLRWVLLWWRLWHPRDQHLLPTTVAVARACVRERKRILAGTWANARPDDFSRRLRKMDRAIHRCAPVKGLRTYQSHYNAACMYAIALYEERETLDERPRELLTERAIRRLELATSFADSAFLAIRQSWLISEDPDLDCLRLRPEFGSLISMYFPGSTAPLQRPERAAELAEARYSCDVIREIARGWYTVWRLRAQGTTADPELRWLPQWWQDERAAWNFVRDFGRETADHATRLQLVRASRLWHTRYSVKFDEPTFPRYEDRPLDYGTVALDHAADQEIMRLTARRLLLAGQLFDSAETDPRPPRTAAHHLAGWLTPRRPLKLRERSLGTICRNRAAVWDQVFAMLDAEWATREEDLASLARALDQMARHEPW